ncbi:YlbE-like family protein [Peribacillus tepidiphilus]|uniref:YlbE-like family protein n=1 Tax=Peribacillus tepidiphilus TaxID=2652445 RepID=UPI0012927B58|nr:YlbE-like family protein [Peribacillus tepidiphilus]
MRQDIYKVIQGNEDLKKYIRTQPIWYRRLSRNPQELEKMETEAKYFFKKSIPHHVSKLSDGVQMASLMMNMFQAMNSTGQ